MSLNTNTINRDIWAKIGEYFRFTGQLIEYSNDPILSLSLFLSL